MSSRDTRGQLLAFSSSHGWLQARRRQPNLLTIFSPFGPRPIPEEPILPTETLESPSTLCFYLYKWGYCNVSARAWREEKQGAAKNQQQQDSVASWNTSLPLRDNNLVHAPTFQKLLDSVTGTIMGLQQLACLLFRLNNQPKRVEFRESLCKYWSTIPWYIPCIPWCADLFCCCGSPLLSCICHGCVASLYVCSNCELLE